MTAWCGAKLLLGQSISQSVEEALERDESGRTKPLFKNPMLV